LLAARHGRDSAICAIGGGVTGDVAGFVAATFLRGIPVVQVPTTLLAMVDASVGGKTAVDVPAGKNLVGAFHPPAAVVIDPQVLDTLPLAERRAGFAEMLKAGVVADARWFDDLASHAATWMVDGVVPPALDDAIATAVRIKQEIVADDPTERGRRAVLNFGHTVAHAIEHATHYGVRHGDAVAIGMVIEAAVGERLGVSTGGSAARIRDACRAAGLPVTMPAGIDPTDVIEAMHTDKKARAGAVRCALPVRIGLMARAGERWTIEVRDDLWPDCLAI
jgi:3-dehydroquinate synthase